MKQIIHAELYRIKNNIVEFLLVKRVPHDGGFWQPITGGIEEGEDVLGSLRREVAEESGIQDLLHVSDELHRTFWDYNGGVGCDLVHAVQVSTEANVVLNPAEHEAHEWLIFQQAVERLYFEGNKQSMQIVHNYIKQRHSFKN